jgi:uncharacterized protein (TIGR03083 family)
MAGDRVAALRRQSEEIVDYCRELTDEQWRTPSRAEGWRVQDVVAHLASAVHVVFTPGAVSLLTSSDVERANDGLVEERRDWEPSRVLAEFETWSGRLAKVASVVARTPVAKVPMPLAELGMFPASVLLTGAFVFDQHTHLHHDIAPALDKLAPASDEPRMEVALEWMFAVFGNQLRKRRPDWVGKTVSISLSGPGGGIWRIGPDGRVTANATAGSVTQISGTTQGFPAWGTGRVPWRESDVKITGDTELGAAVLDWMNIV